MTESAEAGETVEHDVLHEDANPKRSKKLTTKSSKKPKVLKVAKVEGQKAPKVLDVGVDVEA